MTNTSRITLATALMVASGLALTIGAAALATYLLTADGTFAELVVVAGAAGTAIVTGIVGVWLHRLRTVVSAFATVGYLVVGATIVLGAVTTLQDAAAGGFANIGAGLLLLVGSVLAVPATALAVTLAAFYLRSRRYAVA